MSMLHYPVVWMSMNLRPLSLSPVAWPGDEKGEGESEKEKDRSHQCDMACGLCHREQDFQAEIKRPQKVADWVWRGRVKRKDVMDIIYKISIISPMKRIYRCKENNCVRARKVRDKSHTLLLLTDQIRKVGKWNPLTLFPYKINYFALVIPNWNSSLCHTK